ncbi:MAG: YfhO family protein [Gemmatimonadetes bacterium]|nr:YfhO family protein [Gemmatimonadota bacterium]MYG85852.1 YfhO family protein [Gemmatimonadota bacterium]MYJ89732.1 YfhO family protein [Gemmatimonadota bacterium]
MAKRKSTATTSGQRRTSVTTGRPGSPKARKLQPYLGNLLLCLIIAALAVFVYRGYILEGKVDIRPDFIGQAIPFDRFAQDFEEAFDETPLWYPHIFGGMPFQASGTYHHLQYSFEALVNAVLPDRLIDALHGRFFFHLLLGAVSMFFLARALSLSGPASFVAATAFVFSTHMMATEHANRFICFMHVPLVFLAAYRVFDRGRPFDMLLLGAALGSQLSSFHPQIAFYTAMLIGLYAVYAVVNDLRDKTSAGRIVRKSALFAGGVVLAVAVAAVLVLPMQEYAQHSARGLSVGGSDVNVPFATSWSFPPVEILTFIIPSFAGFGGPLYWGDMPFTDFPNYLGIVVVVLAVAGIVLNRSRMTLFLVIAAVLALLVSFGRHLPPVSYVMLHFVPFFGKFRAPVMILVLSQFAVALLAGYGVHALLERMRAGKDTLGSFAKRLCVVAGGALLLVLALTVFESSFQSFMTGVYTEADAAHGARSAMVTNADYHAGVNAMRFYRLMGDLWIMVLLLCAASALIYATRKTSPRLLAAGLGALVVVDLLLVASRVVNPEDDPARIEAYYAARETEVVKALKDDPGPYRILPLSEFSSNEFGYFGISSIGGYHAAKLGVYQELMDEVGFSSFPVLNMLNTRYLVSRQPLQAEGLTSLVESEGSYLYRNETALPRAFLVDSVRVIAEKDAIFEAMRDPGFRPGEYAILENAVGDQLGPLGNSSVEITLHTPHRIEMTVDAAARCLLVLSEIYYPAGWRATMDGHPAEILQTNYVLRSVAVPEGRHEVVMTFEPASFTAGHLVSRIASALVLAGLIAAGAMRIRKNLKNRA